MGDISTTGTAAFQIVGGIVQILNLKVTGQAILPGAVQERETDTIKSTGAGSWDTAIGTTGGSITTNPWNNIPDASGGQATLTFENIAADYFGTVRNLVNYQISYGISGTGGPGGIQIEVALFVDGIYYKTLEFYTSPSAIVNVQENRTINVNEFVFFSAANGDTQTVELKYRYFSNSTTGAIAWKGGEFFGHMMKG